MIVFASKGLGWAAFHIVGHKVPNKVPDRISEKGSQPGFPIGFRIGFPVQGTGFPTDFFDEDPNMGS